MYLRAECLRQGFTVQKKFTAGAQTAKHLMSRVWAVNQAEVQVSVLPTQTMG